MVKIMKSGPKHSPPSRNAPPTDPFPHDFSPSYYNHAPELLHRPRYISNLLTGQV